MNNFITFDLSTHTGWALFREGHLINCGEKHTKIADYKSDVKSYRDLPASYPYNFICAAREMAQECHEVYWTVTNGEVPIVTEHTEGSSHRFSQRILEFIHLEFFRSFEKTPVIIRYLLNSDWRRETQCYISRHPEIVKYNSIVSKLKKKAKPTKSGAKVAKLDGKVVSRVDAKKLSIRLAKEAYPAFADRILSDNIADAINLGRAAIKLL